MTTTQQEHDVVDLLLTQHNEIKSLFAEVKASPGDVKRGAFRLRAVRESAAPQHRPRPAAAYGRRRPRRRGRLPDPPALCRR